jgi:ribonucleoside-diphosphate reductase alpha chain
MERMCVVKRCGTRQEVSFDKVLNRIRELCVASEIGDALTNVNYEAIATKVIGSIHDGIKTSELDDIAAAQAQPMVTEHYEYGILAARLLISNYIKNCEQRLMSRYSGAALLPKSGQDIGTVCKSLLWTFQALWENVDENGSHSPKVAPHVWRFIQEYHEELEALIDYRRDYLLNFAGMSLAMEQYLLQCSFVSGSAETMENVVRIPIERPQHTFLRVALGIWLPYPETAFRDQLDSAVTESVDRARIVHADFWRNALGSYTGIWCSEQRKLFWGNIRATYEMLSNMYAMHATPTLFHSGTPTPQLSSCFLTCIEADSLDSIYDWNKRQARISKWAGGMGSWIHNIRPAGSYIAGTGGHSNGIVPMLRVTNETSKYVDQGGSKRPGSHAIYLEMWHGDIVDFIDLKKPRVKGGNEERRARSLFYGLWICDEFMRTVEEEERLYQAGEAEPKLWYLMDPNKCPGLDDVYDKTLHIRWLTDDEVNNRQVEFAFTALYRQYIKKRRYMRVVSARAIWKQICDVTTETSIPYKMFKDAVNRKSNQSNVGVIKSSNLCTEITEYSDAKETAVCNLGSICLGKYVVSTKPAGADAYPFADGFAVDIDVTNSKRAWFDFAAMAAIVKTIMRNLDRIITQNYYPVQECRTSNMRHRPVGLGVQGLADCFTKLWLPFDSEQALKLDYYIHEVINFASKQASCELAKDLGAYSTFKGSPVSAGHFQRDMWKQEADYSDQKIVIPDWEALPYPRSQNWGELYLDIAKYGLRNSLTGSNMPTASTSTFTGGSPAFEPHNAMWYKRKDKIGESYVCNYDLQRTLMVRGLWTPEVRNAIFRSRTGGIQDCLSIPKQIRDVYKSAFDISPKAVINHMLIRGAEIDQAQSMNLFIASPNHQIITQTIFYSWKRGGKNGCYYLRELPAADAKKIQLTDPNVPGLAGTRSRSGSVPDEPEVCKMENGCLMCSS